MTQIYLIPSGSEKHVRLPQKDWEYNPDYILYDDMVYQYSHSDNDCVYYVVCGNGISL